MDLNHKNILIVGLGKSGIAAARFARKNGAFVTVTDMAGEKELGVHAAMAHKLGVIMELGKHDIKTFERADLIVLSPGVPHTILPIQRAMAKGVPHSRRIRTCCKIYPGTGYWSIRYQRQNHNHHTFGQYAQKFGG